MAAKSPKQSAGFFDLPAELRIDIYRLACTACYDNYAGVIEGNRSYTWPVDDKEYIPADFARLEPWRGYLSLFLETQCISH